MLQFERMKSGAGGNWRRFDEKFDVSIIKQESGLSCVSAVGEMLLKNRGIFVSQAKIRDIIGEPAAIESLAEVLNIFDNSDDGKSWHGHATDIKSLEILFRMENWAVFMVDDFVLNRMLHAVFIEGKTNGDLVKIKDTFDQTSYKMTMPDFIKHWGGQIIYRK